VLPQFEILVKLHLLHGLTLLMSGSTILILCKLIVIDFRNDRPSIPSKVYLFLALSCQLSAQIKWYIPNEGQPDYILERAEKITGCISLLPWHFQVNQTWISPGFWDSEIRRKLHDFFMHAWTSSCLASADRQPQLLQEASPAQVDSNTCKIMKKAS